MGKNGLNPQLISIIDDAVNRLHTKLSKLPVESLPISEYNRRYLSNIVVNLYAELDKYAGILKYMLLVAPPSAQDNCRILDYGGGTGILSLIACESGFRQVWYNDIYDVSCRDAKAIADALNLCRTDYILGDLPDVIDYCRGKGEKFHAVGSYDVIEHVYDIEAFLTKLHLILDEHAVVFMCSGANPYNEDIYRQLVETHTRCEYFDRQETYGWKKRDSLAAYAKIRKSIISDYLKSHGCTLPDEKIADLVFYTRGLIKHDIENAVSNFITNTVYPKLDTKFPTNTCDPMTGNWAEHLMDFERLIPLLQESGFNMAQTVPDKTMLDKSSTISLIGVRVSQSRSDQR